MLETLLLLQSFAPDGSSFPIEATSVFFEAMQRGIRFSPYLGLGWLLVLVVTQILGALAIQRAAAHAEKIDGTRQLIFSPIMWGLLGLVTGPLGLLATALALWWLGYASYTEDSDTAGSQLVKRSARTGGLGSGAHRTRVAKLRAELEALENAPKDPDEEPGEEQGS